MDYFFLLPLIGLALAMVGGGLLISHLLAPRNPSKSKSDTYECGEQTIGPSHVQFNVGYYLFGLIFLVFDVEAVFLFPWALVLKEVGVMALVEVVLFIAILLVGFVYAWRKGALEWV